MRTVWITGPEQRSYRDPASHLTWEEPMKIMTCKQLGGACDTEFRASSFEEIAEMSKQHGMEMFQRKDAPHLKAMRDMQELMTKPEAMKAWFADRKAEFESLPES
jgi:predicted small metal-binding protein